MAWMLVAPEVPDGADSGTVETWLVGEGAAVHEGDPLAVLRFPDQALRVFADGDGVLLHALRGGGAPVAAGSPLALLGRAGESLAARDGRRCVRLRLLARCGECGRDHPVNGLLQRARCPACQHVRSLGARFWTDGVFDSGVWSLPRALGSFDGAEVISPAYGRLRLDAASLPPVCGACRWVLPWDGMEGDARCPRCDAGYRVRDAPPWARRAVPGLARLVGETDVDAADQPPAAGAVVTVRCERCGASLPVDGTQRHVRCAYCQADQVLADGLWQRLHPAARRVPWWCVFDDAPP